MRLWRRSRGTNPRDYDREPVTPYCLISVLCISSEVGHRDDD